VALIGGGHSGAQCRVEALNVVVGLAFIDLYANYKSG
jgi:hypothetical protein